MAEFLIYLGATLFSLFISLIMAIATSAIFAYGFVFAMSKLLIFISREKFEQHFETHSNTYSFNLLLFSVNIYLILLWFLIPMMMNNMQSLEFGFGCTFILTFIYLVYRLRKIIATIKQNKNSKSPNNPIP